jgi:hypothetical protein
MSLLVTHLHPYAYQNSSQMANKITLSVISPSNFRASIKLNMAFFWDVVLCSHVHTDQHSEEFTASIMRAISHNHEAIPRRHVYIFKKYLIILSVCQGYEEGTGKNVA